MHYRMRTGCRPVPCCLVLVAAFVLGAGGAPGSARAQYPSKFEPYNAYYYSLHAPYYYYLSPESAPAPSARAAPDPRDWYWGGWGAGRPQQWAWLGGWGHGRGNWQGGNWQGGNWQGGGGQRG